MNLNDFIFNSTINYTPTYTQFFLSPNEQYTLHTVQNIVMIQIQYSHMLFPERPNTPEKRFIEKLVTLFTFGFSCLKTNN